MITQQISQLNGLDRNCSIEVIEFMDFKNKHAKLKFVIEFPLINLSRELWHDLSDSNRVNEDGRRITRAYTDSIFVQPDKLEEGQTIEQLMNDHYNAIYDAGFPEFSFWWQIANKHGIEISLKNGILMLDHLGFFN